jgi:hypothetical protein
MNSITPTPKAGNENQASYPAKSRVQLDFPPRAMAILTEIKEKTESASYAEVIRKALKLYDGLITEVENGAEFMIRNKDGSLSPFKMFL